MARIWVMQYVQGVRCWGDRRRGKVSPGDTDFNCEVVELACSSDLVVSPVGRGLTDVEPLPCCVAAVTSHGFCKRARKLAMVCGNLLSS